MVEKSLHEAVKRWYARSGDSLETVVEGYVVDVVRGDLLVEVQTGNFSALKEKLGDLTRSHRVRLVHPVPSTKWIVRLSQNGEELSRRRSPKKGRVEEVFYELVYLPEIVAEPNLSLEVLLVEAEEVLIDDGRGSWRRRWWSVHDRRLLRVVERTVFHEPQDFLELLPEGLPERFTVKDLAERKHLRSNLAQKMAYCLRKMGATEVVGRRGRALLYSKRDG